MSSSYYLSSIAQDDADSVMELATTLSSLTVNELPLILPLLQHLQHNILANPAQTLLSTLFISIWNRVAGSLHQQQVASLLLEVLTTLLEQSLQLRNYQPLLVLLERKELKAMYRSLGPKQVLKVLLPLLLEHLLNSQTPERVAAAIGNSLAYLASPPLLGATLTTRYILPTLTLKTGSVTFKRTELMKRWGEDDLLQLKYSPAAQSLLKVLPYVTTEAVLSIVLPHLCAKAYSSFQFVTPSSAVTTLKSTQAAMSVDEIVAVVDGFLPYASDKTLQYGLLQAKAPQLSDLLRYLYLPTDKDDAYLV